MARAFHSAPANYGDASQSDDWQALRGELVALLDQVEGQYAGRAGMDPAFAGFAERMRDLRHKVADAEPEDRRREALRSVKRQVDRFSERSEADSPPDDAALQSAIREIRARTRPELRSEPARPAEPRGEAASAPDLNSRLRRLEAELLARSDGNAQVSEISDHLSQLTRMVEMLAGSIGDNGQTERLEAQIAGLAQLLARGPQADIGQLADRIDQVAATVDRLADLQVKQIEHTVREAETAPGKDAEQARGLKSVEESLRHIYDRMDALEHSFAMPSAEFERMGAMLAEIGAQVSKSASQPAASPAQQDRLVSLIDALNGRVGEMEGRHAGIDSLKTDIDDLRETVLEAIEPRFQDIQQRLGDIKDRLTIRSADPPGVAQLEAQIRQLVARMDQSAEQLARIAETREQSAPVLPDAEHFADMVASRTSAVLARQAPPAAGAASLSEASLTEIEARIGRLVEGFLRSQPSAGRWQPATTTASAAPAGTTVDRVGIERAALERAALAREAAARPPRSAGIADTMPRNPGDDAPLTDSGFADLGPVRTALEARGSATAEPAPILQDAPPAPGKPSFDAASVPLPPRPRSSFDVEPAAVPNEPAQPEAGGDRVPPSSRNTFIEAARRAAQRQQAVAAAAPANVDSPIGRALSRFQPGGKPAPTPELPEVAEKSTRSWFKRKPAAAAEAPLPEMPADEPLFDAGAQPAAGHSESFLVRYRRPILIAASLAAVSFMALNLVMQRMAEGNRPAVASPMATSKPAPTAPADAKPSAAAPAPAPAAAPAASLKPASLVLPLSPHPSADIPTTTVPPTPSDAMTTASIDPGAPLGYASSAPIPPALAAVDAATAAPSPAPTTPATTVASPPPVPLESPVKLDLPPEAVGPLELRQAAANGDARAQFEIAAIYSEGHAVPQDMAQAATWYERAAAQGFVPAQYRLGNLYELGQGLTKDLEQARLWYQRAAEAGNRMAMHNLAALYAGGQFGKQDFTQAADWFEQAADHGMKDSQFNLGMLYARGLGVTQDLDASYKWFALAAATGDAEAAKARDNIARSLDPAALKKDEAEVAAWKPMPIDLAANFAPIGTWQKNFNPGPAITDKDVVTKVQQALARLGYDIGAPNGKIGAKTSQAIKSFEHGTGMTEIGAINPRLLAVLGSQPV